MSECVRKERCRVGGDAQVVDVKIDKTVPVCAEEQARAVRRPDGCELVTRVRRDALARPAAGVVEPEILCGTRRVDDAHRYAGSIRGHSDFAEVCGSGERGDAGAGSIEPDGMRFRSERRLNREDPVVRYAVTGCRAGGSGSGFGKRRGFRS